jgi:hypothetical protein
LFLETRSPVNAVDHSETKSCPVAPETSAGARRTGLASQKPDLAHLRETN